MAYGNQRNQMNRGPSRVANTRNRASMQRPGTPFSAGRSQGQNGAGGNQQQCPAGSKPQRDTSTGRMRCVSSANQALGTRLGRVAGQGNTSGPVMGSVGTGRRKGY